MIVHCKIIKIMTKSVDNMSAIAVIIHLIRSFFSHTYVLITLSMSIIFHIIFGIVVVDIYNVFWKY